MVNSMYSYENIQMVILDEIKENYEDSLVFYSEYLSLNDKYDKDKLTKDNKNAKQN